MCLACEMDALWFAELEAGAAGSAGVLPALKSHSASPTLGSPEGAGTTPAVAGGFPSPRRPGEQAGRGEEAERDARAPGPHFRCEETGS